MEEEAEVQTEDVEVSLEATLEDEATQEVKLREAQRDFSMIRLKIGAKTAATARKRLAEDMELQKN